MEHTYLSTLGLGVIAIVFVAAAIVISIAGTYLTKFADQIADVTRLGEALVGAVLLGAVTSLAGVVTTLSAAIQGHPDLAVSNAIGGIAAQTFFLAIADITYKKVNLEHASASLSNLMYSVILIGLLAALLFIMMLPEVVIGNVNPGSIVIILIYLSGLWLVSKAEKKPMWNPILTADTVKDIPKPLLRINQRRMWIGFILCALLVIVAGYLVADAGIELAARTRMSESFVGGLFTAVATSMPELIVGIAAVRQGSIILAVSNIVGGNSFEVIVVALADFFYPRSILHAASPNESYIIILTILLMSILLLGLLYRQEKGIAKIGWESFLIILVFVGGYTIFYFITLP